MPIKPHPTDPDKMVYVNRYYDIPQLQGVTMTPEDEEFNRIEREAVARKMTVKYNLARQLERDGMSRAQAQNLTIRLLPEAIPFITPEEYQQLLKDFE
jgi:hypothetical protein